MREWIRGPIIIERDIVGMTVTQIEMHLKLPLGSLGSAVRILQVERCPGLAEFTGETLIPRNHRLIQVQPLAPTPQRAGSGDWTLLAPLPARQIAILGAGEKYWRKQTPCIRCAAEVS